MVILAPVEKPREEEEEDDEKEDAEVGALVGVRAGRDGRVALGVLMPRTEVASLLLR